VLNMKNLYLRAVPWELVGMLVSIGYRCFEIAII
jgi:hypothetical protein